MKFYATIEPYIYIIILPIMREEVGGLVPKIMNFESTMMYTTNIVFMDFRVMDVVFVIPKTEDSTPKIPLTPKPFPRQKSRVNISFLFSLDFLALMTVCCSI